MSWIRPEENRERVLGALADGYIDEVVPRGLGILPSREYPWLATGKGATSGEGRGARGERATNDADKPTSDPKKRDLATGLVTRSPGEWRLAAGLRGGAHPGAQGLDVGRGAAATDDRRRGGAGRSGKDGGEVRPWSDFGSGGPIGGREQVSEERGSRGRGQGATK
jgi:hypothetical protein